MNSIVRETVALAGGERARGPRLSMSGVAAARAPASPRPPLLALVGQRRVVRQRGMRRRTDVLQVT